MCAFFYSRNVEERGQWVGMIEDIMEENSYGERDKEATTVALNNPFISFTWPSFQNKTLSN